MRAILVLALFCLATTALSFNYTRYHIGFAEKLQLNARQTRNAAVCQNSLKRTVTSFGNLLTGRVKSIDNLIFTALDVYNGMKRQVLVDCQAYVFDLATLVLSANPSSQDLPVIAQQNLNTYAPQIVQQLSKWTDLLITGDFYNAGATQAYILQIIFGLEKPKVLPTPVLKSESIVEVNYTKLIREYVRTYFTKIGLTDEATINSTITCLNQAMTQGPVVAASYNNISALATLEDQLLASIDVYNKVIDLITPCATSYVGMSAYSAPVSKNFAAAPVLFMATMIRNVASNAPQVQQIQQQMDVDVKTGQYAHAGEVTAQLYKILFSNLGA